jgi:hypothetical protein
LAAGCILPLVFVQALVLVLLGIAWTNFQWRPVTFLAGSLLVMIVSYAVVGWVAWRDVARLKNQYPMVSLEQRLPPLPPGPVHLTPASAERLDALEAEDYPLREPNYRTDRLRELHEETLNVFINRPGFGVTRGSGYREGAYRLGIREDRPVAQPGPRTLLPWSTDFARDTTKPIPPDADTEKMHRAGVVDFVHPNGFGYVRDKAHVAGFQEHQFLHVPEASGRWKLRTLDLVGLLMHPRPVAYVSENLPRMDELREAPVRALDEFEEAGLKKLRGGDDFFIRQAADGRRMLGSIRSVKQCLRCHDGPRGSLLGAFSYTFTPGE